MLVKLLKGEWLKLKQEHHIMQALRFGKISHMILKVIFGL